MAELKEVCSLLGFGQVARDKKDATGENYGIAVCTSQPHNQESNIPLSAQQGSAPRVASVPSQQQPGTASLPGEGQDPLTTVTACNDDLVLANTVGEVSKISQPAMQSPSQGLASYPAPSTGLSAATKDGDDGDNVNCKEVSKEMNSFKSRLRSSAVAASKKLAETAAHKRKKKYSHHEIDSRQLQSDPTQSKPDRPVPSVSNSMLAEPVAQTQIPLRNVRHKSSGWDINSNDCREEKFKLRSKAVIGNHGKVWFQLRPRSVSKKYSGSRSIKLGEPESLEMIDQMNPTEPPKLLIPSVPTSAGCDSQVVMFKGDQSVESKESEGNIEFTQDAPVKCRTRKKR